MKAITTFHKPSSVSSSAKCKLIAGSEFLVVAKLDRLEVFSFQPEGLKLECELEIWGRLLAVKAIPVGDSGRDNVALLTDHPDPELILLSYVINNGIGELKTEHHLSLFERSGRASEYFTNMMLDSSGTTLAVSCYVGKLKIIMLDEGAYDRDFDVSLPELNLLALTFLAPGATSDELCLGILHVDHEQRLQLLSRDLDLDHEQLSPKPSTILPSIPLPVKHFSISAESLPILLAVPPPLEVPAGTEATGGILILGGKKILFYDVAPSSAQKKAIGKQNRSEKKKKAARKSGDANEIEKEKQKEEERLWKKKKSRSSVEWPWSTVATCCIISDGKYLVGDAYGKLAMLSVESLVERKLTLLALGETSPATTLSYLTSQVIYIGSHFGDSQVLRICTAPESALDSPTLPVPLEIPTITPSQLTELFNSSKGKGKASDSDVTMGGEEVKETEGRGIVVVGKGSYLSTIQTFKNIAPIMDAALVDIDRSGQHQIITCSGGRSTGSLNIVRNGANFEALAAVEGLFDITNMWPLRTMFEDSKDTHLLVTTLHDSHLFRFEGSSRISGISPSATALVMTEPTLAIQNIAERRTTTNAQGKSVSTYVDGSLVVQATKTGVRMFEYDMNMGSYIKVSKDWAPSHPGQEIVVASLNASQFVVGLSGGKLVLLNSLEKELNEVASIHTAQGEISAVTCVPMTQSKFTTVIAASFWGSHVVGIYSPAENLRLILQSPELPALPRSLLFCNFGTDRGDPGYAPHLLVGLADGNAVSFKYNKKALEEKKVFSLGDSPVFITPCQLEDRYTVFACGSRASILFREREMLQHSTVNLKDVSAASWLNTTRFSSCLILATPSGLLIGKIKDIDKMHIRSIPTGFESPRRISYHQSLSMYGVISVRTQPARVGAVELSQSIFKVLDNISLNPLARYECGIEQEMTAVHALDTPLSCFAVGICRYNPGDVEPSNGQLLIFSMQTSNEIHVKPAGSAEVHGCIFAFANVGTMLAVAVNSSVMIYAVALQDDGSSDAISLHKVAEWNHNYFVVSLVSYGNTLMLGDAISSISFLQLDGTKLRVIARDYGSLWPVCVEPWSDKSVIGANSDHNIFSFTLEQTELETTLKRDGSFYIGDMVNKFIAGALSSSDTVDDSDVLETKQIFFTSSGRIGMVVDVDRDTSIHLSGLQRNMSPVMTSCGELKHAAFRAPRNRKGRSDAEAGSVGFLDGDFLEHFLTVQSTQTISQILEGSSPAERLTISREAIHKVLERLRSLH